MTASVSVPLSQTQLPPEVLLDYATGAAPEPIALAVATVLALNPEQAALYQRLNALGGQLLDTIPTVPTSDEDEGLSRILARLDQEPQEAAPPEGDADAAQEQPGAAQSLASQVPFPLRSYIGADFDRVAWHSVMPGVEEHVIKTGHTGYRCFLMRIAPGKAMPRHTHKGLEFTVVLQGAYAAADHHFGVGDMEVADPQVLHKPIADSRQGCLCLAVLTAPLRLKGALGWLVNPFLRI